MNIIKLIIDDKPVVVEQGTTILEAAKSIGIKIPSLCYMKMDDLNFENKPGGCRVCVIEVEGRRNLAPACKTECTEGMVVKTHTVRVINARRTVVELILSDHPAECLTCRNWLKIWVYGKYIIPVSNPIIKVISHRPLSGKWTNVLCAVVAKPFATRCKPSGYYQLSIAASSRWWHRLSKWTLTIRFVPIADNVLPFVLQGL